MLKNKVLQNLLLVCFLFVLFEGISRAVFYYGLIPLKNYATSNERTILDDINPHFGVWRYPNRSARHTHACFDVEYRSNNHGMRDNTRKLVDNVNKRIVLLGDSFVEGYGVDEKFRFSNINETNTNIQMLNFGVSGDFSSTQEYLLYKTLASKFNHDAVFLFLLPSNDFLDNDIHQEQFGRKRFRPYLRSNDENQFEIYYPIKFEDRTSQEEMDLFQRLRRESYNRVYLLNLVRQLGEALERSKLKDFVTDPILNITKTSYDDYSEDDFKKLIWGYENIVKLADKRPLHIFIIPREVDFMESKKQQEEFKLVNDLREFTEKYQNVHLHDLLPVFETATKDISANIDDIFLPCDAHWSHLGHKIVAQYIQERILPPL